jgi:hypothetical protein
MTVQELIIELGRFQKNHKVKILQDYGPTDLEIVRKQEQNGSTPIALLIPTYFRRK